MAASSQEQAMRSSFKQCETLLLSQFPELARKGFIKMKITSEKGYCSTPGSGGNCAKINSIYAVCLAKTRPDVRIRMMIIRQNNRIINHVVVVSPEATTAGELLLFFDKSNGRHRILPFNVYASMGRQVILASKDVLVNDQMNWRALCDKINDDAEFWRQLCRKTGKKH
jgi:hypothetical protein